MSSISPRLDEVNHRLGVFNKMSHKVSSELGISLENHETFSFSHHWLWSSRDSVDLSTIYGLPLLLRAIASHIPANMVEGGAKDASNCPLHSDYKM